MYVYPIYWHISHEFHIFALSDCTSFWDPYELHSPKNSPTIYVRQRLKSSHINRSTQASNASWMISQNGKKNKK